MTNTNVKTNTAQTENFFNSIMYAQVSINSVRVVRVKKGSNYAVLSASIIDLDENGKKTYTPIELRASGEKVNAILREFRDEWPKRDNKVRWTADVNIGSIEDDLYPSKKYQCNKPTLRGRLINIRSLNMGGKTVIGEQQKLQKPMLVAQAYVNQIDMADGTAKASILDGKVTEPNYRKIQLSFENISIFDELNEKGLCPRGFDYRKEDARIYSILVIEGVHTEIYEYDGEDQTTLKGMLTGVRYLKAGEEVMTKAKPKLQQFAEGFKEGFNEAAA